MIWAAAAMDSVNRKAAGVHTEVGGVFSASPAAAAAEDQLMVSEGSCDTSVGSVMGNTAAQVLQPGCLRSPLCEEQLR